MLQVKHSAERFAQVRAREIYPLLKSILVASTFWQL